MHNFGSMASLTDYGNAGVSLQESGLTLWREIDMTHQPDGWHDLWYFWAKTHLNSVHSTLNPFSGPLAFTFVAFILHLDQEPLFQISKSASLVGRLLSTLIQYPISNQILVRLVTVPRQLSEDTTTVIL